MTKVIWIGQWSDDGKSVAELVRFLKSEGLRAKADRSPYVGHYTLKVAKDDVEKAKPLLTQATGDDYISKFCF